MLRHSQNGLVRWSGSSFHQRAQGLPLGVTKKFAADSVMDSSPSQLLPNLPKTCVVCLQLVKSPISANVSVEYAVMAAGLVQVGQGCVLPPSSVLHVSIADEREHRVDEAGMHDWE
eukprot:1144956-Pelagomonas_calceolata.AAC.5